MKFKVMRGDIVVFKVGAIVTSASKKMDGDGESVDGRIHQAAGPNLLKACKKNGELDIGLAAITDGFNLNAGYVIHAAGPRYDASKQNECKYLLTACYVNCLDAAMSEGVKTIALPCISTGAYGYPKRDAAIIAIDAVEIFLRKNPETISEIYFVVNDDENEEIYRGLIPDN